MATHTTREEDRVMVQCSAFGGYAGECVEIIERLDALLCQALDDLDTIKAKLQELGGE